MRKTFNLKTKILLGIGIVLLFFFSLAKTESKRITEKTVETIENNQDVPNEFLIISGIGPFSNLLILNQFRKK